MPRSAEPASHSASPPEQKARPAPVSTIVRTSSRVRISRSRFHEVPSPGPRSPRSGGPVD